MVAFWKRFTFRNPNTQDAHPMEQPKVVLKRGIRSRLFDIAIHLVPLAATAVTLYLAISQHYWQDPSGPQTQSRLQGLQFIAKIYESAICLSLGSFLLYVLRRDLIDNRGVTIGALVSAYSFDHISVVFSPSFWAIFQSRRSEILSSSRLIFFLILSIILAVASGPSAAIGIIPRLGWWPQPWDASFNPGLGGWGRNVLFSIHAPHSELWPQVLDSSSIPAEGCGNVSEGMSQFCPGAGQTTLLNSATYWERNLDSYGFSRPSSMESLNLSTLEATLARSVFTRPLTAMLPCYFDPSVEHPGQQYGAISVSSSLLVASTLWNVHQFSHNTGIGSWERALLEARAFDSSPPLQPFSSVKCIDAIQDTDYNKTSILRFPNSGIMTSQITKEQAKNFRYPCATWTDIKNPYEGMDLTVSEKDVIDSDQKAAAFRSNRPYFTWVDAFVDKKGPSHAAAIYFPPCKDTPSAIYTCSIDARWLPMSSWIEPGADISVHGILRSYRHLLTSLANENNPSEPIRIHKEWAAALNPYLADGTTAIQKILTKALLNPSAICLYPYNAIPLRTLEAYIGLTVTEGLSRVGLGHNYSVMTFSRSNPSTPNYLSVYNSSNSYVSTIQDEYVGGAPTWTNGSFRYERYGYGYGLGTVTSKIAIAVLLLHACAALCAIACLLFDAKVSRSWGSFSEVFLLAMQSRPPVSPELSNCGAGAKTSSAWKRRIMVRAEKSTSRLGLVVKDEISPEEHVKIEAGQPYS